MILINSFYSLLLFINLLLSVGSQNCNFITDFIKDNKLFLFNTSESVVFLPTKYSSSNLTDSDWVNYCIGYLEVCTSANGVLYKGEELTSLSEADLKISDNEFTDAIHAGFLKNKQLPEVISVSSNKYAIRRLEIDQKSSGLFNTFWR